ncbi:MAG: methyltransferase [Bacteriovoracaceae bacterium]|nr:methyltransferase [Bacteriovoracaceae bacterium]
MIDYSQPDFYRFNEDSLKLVSWVKQKVLKASHLLDLGAGSGVIGIELANILRPQQLTLVEAQEDYEPHLRMNVGTQLNETQPAEIVLTSFGNWHPSISYDLIVCNPPYFLPGHGEAYKDSRREKARAFVLDNWPILLTAIENSLSPEGKAFIVIKNNKTILKEIAKHQSRLSCEIHEQGSLVFLELTRLNIDRS